MLERIKNVYRRIVYGKKLTSEEFVAHLRARGVEVGEDVIFYSPDSNVIDLQYPWLMRIGSHVRITKGVIMLTHDYSWSVLKRFHDGVDEGRIFGACGKVEIGDNVFIGMDAVIMRGVTIGNDVIIGANAVVTKDCESGWVYGGNPAKKIMTVADFYKKREQAQIPEAKMLARAYYDRCGQLPPQEIFHEFFMLFCTEDQLLPAFREKMKLCGNEEASYAAMGKHPPVYPSYEAFLEDCGLPISKEKE